MIVFTSAKLVMFTATFMSLSWFALQSGHVHTRSVSQKSECALVRSFPVTVIFFSRIEDVNRYLNLYVHLIFEEVYSWIAKFSAECTVIKSSELSRFTKFLGEY